MADRLNDGLHVRMRMRKKRIKRKKGMWHSLRQTLMRLMRLMRRGQYIIFPLKRTRGYFLMPCSPQAPHLFHFRNRPTKTTSNPNKIKDVGRLGRLGRFLQQIYPKPFQTPHNNSVTAVAQ